MSATNRGAKRQDNDFYPTPRNAIEALARCIDPEYAKMYSWGEPAAGMGDIIYEWSHLNGLEPNQWEWAELMEGRNYLRDGLTGRAECIITNPPFSIAQEFITKTLSGNHLFVAYLLRLNFWGSKKRRDWWRGKEPTHQITLAERPRFIWGKGTDATEYAWFCWDYCGMLGDRKPMTVE